MDKCLIAAKYPLKKEVEIFDICSIYVFSFTPSYRTSTERHPQLELIYVDDGIEEVYEDDKTYQVKKGEMFLHKSNSPHKDRCLSPHSTCYILSFNAESPHFHKLFDRVIVLTKNETTQLKELFELYFNNVDSPIDMFVSDRKIIIEKNLFAISQIIKNKFELFFISLLSSDAKESSPLRNYDDPLVNLILKELHERKYEKFSLTKISTNLSYSRSYLCRHFKDVTGATIINYFYSIKIEEAKKLLISGKYSIEETSDMLNFDSVQYFSKVFKKYCGLSPSTWRSISTERKYY